MRATWALLLLLSVGVPVLARFAGVSIAWEQFWTLPALAIAVGAIGVLLRAHGRWPRLADVAEVAHDIQHAGLMHRGRLSPVHRHSQPQT